MIATDNCFIIACNNEGLISKVYFNSSGIADDYFINKLFPELFRKEYINTALDFLVKIKKHLASFGYELFLPASLSKEPFYFYGILMGQEIIIIGSKHKRELESSQKIIYDEKQKANNDLLNALSGVNNELIDMQREITKKNLELAELNKLKNQFLGIAVHDLRNPLGIILNFIELLEDDKDTFTQEQYELISHIKYLSSFMLNLVNDLLDVTTIESGSIKLTPEIFDIVKLMHQTIHLNKALADKKDIRILFQPEIESVHLFLDRAKIEQVFTNLLTNAIKYSNSNTNITIEMKKINKEILISVIDEGQGIAESELNLLFKPFQRTSSISTRGEKSTGLGLFIVKKIIEAQNGKIWVESEPGKGSKFHFKFPLENNEKCINI